MIKPAKIDDLHNTIDIRLKEVENGWMIAIDSCPRQFVAKSDEEMIDIVKTILKPYRDGIVKYNLEPNHGLDVEE